MTGDVCEISDGTYGILISPECDISEIEKLDLAEFEFLVFENGGFEEQMKKLDFDRSVNKIDEMSSGKPLKAKQKLRQVFNNGEAQLHYFPSMPLLNEAGTNACVINFRWGAKRIPSVQVKTLKRVYKVNSPFIQQLRQRYLAYVGRVGTPALPAPVRDWNLSYMAPPAEEVKAEEAKVPNDEAIAVEKKTSNGAS